MRRSGRPQLIIRLGKTIRKLLVATDRTWLLLVVAVTLAACSGGGDKDSVTDPVQGPVAIVTISGTMQYEFPPPITAPGNNCDGLNFDPGAIQLRPIRQATVQVLDDTGTVVLDSDVTNDLGAYSVSVNASTDVILRVRAEMINGGSPSWDVEVRNNVVDPNSDTVDPAALPLEQRPIYVMDSSVFNSGVLDQPMSLTATTGWGVNSYTSPRVAAPFAVLDTIYEAMLLILNEEPLINFSPLDAFWSADNRTELTVGTFEDYTASGKLGGVSFYFRGTTLSGTVVQPSLFFLGKDGQDTEEFDDHVIVHEWGHYFEDIFSRSDSIGGAHGVGDRLDMRLAFGEGFATALSAIALNNPSYCDSLWLGPQLTGFEINAENESAQTEEAWYNEISVMKIVYDFWDTVDDGTADNSSIGFSPIYSVMRGPQSTTPAFTSIFSFATEVKSVTGQDAFIDALLNAANIDTTGLDIYGSTEVNEPPLPPPPDNPIDVLPVYTDLTVGNTVNICSDSYYDTSRDGNKLSEHRFLKLNIPVAQQLTFTMTRVSPAPTTPTPGFDCTADVNDPENHEHSDPDFIVWRNGSVFLIAISCEPNTELTTPANFGVDEYVIDISEFRHEDEDSPVGYPEQICFDFTAN